MSDKCQHILDNGIFDEMTFQNESQFGQFITEVLNLSEDQLRNHESVSQDDFSTGALYDAFSAFIESKAYSKTTIETILRMRLNFQSGQALESNDRTWFKSKVVSEKIVTAWRICVTEHAKATGIQPEITGDVNSLFTVFIKWIPSDANESETEITSVNPINLDFVGNISFKKGAGIETFTGLAQTFVRRIPEQPASLVVALKGYPPLNLEWPVEHIPDRNVPVGTVIASAVQFEQFTKEYNPDVDSKETDKIMWIPADGRQVHGSMYQKLTMQNNVPDLRGQFLRGLNKFASIEPEPIAENRADPDGLRVPGSFQPDEFKSHMHSVPTVSSSHHSAGDSGGPRTALGGATSTGKTGGHESRPKNIAVFFYIKIN